MEIEELQLEIRGKNLKRNTVLDFEDTIIFKGKYKKASKYFVMIYISYYPLNARESLKRELFEPLIGGYTDDNGIFEIEYPMKLLKNEIGDDEQDIHFYADVQD